MPLIKFEPKNIPNPFWIKGIRLIKGENNISPFDFVALEKSEQYKKLVEDGMISNNLLPAPPAPPPPKKEVFKKKTSKKKAEVDVTPKVVESIEPEVIVPANPVFQEEDDL